MNTKALAELGRNAKSWAATYVRLKEALQREGVADDEAERTASLASNMAAHWEQGSGDPCPLCGRET